MRPSFQDIGHGCHWEYGTNSLGNKHFFTSLYISQHLQHHVIPLHQVKEKSSDNTLYKFQVLNSPV